MGATIIKHLEFFHVNKSCKIECCGNKMHEMAGGDKASDKPCEQCAYTDEFCDLDS